MLKRKIKLTSEEVAELTGTSGVSNKRAAATIIDLRTRLEVRTLFLTCSIALNMAFITAKLIGK